jgi:hypothetical protein
MALTGVHIRKPVYETIEVTEADIQAEVELEKRFHQQNPYGKLQPVNEIPFHVHYIRRDGSDFDLDVTFFVNKTGSKQPKTALITLFQILFGVTAGSQLYFDIKPQLQLGQLPSIYDYDKSSSFGNYDRMSIPSILAKVGYDGETTKRYLDDLDHFQGAVGGMKKLTKKMEDDDFLENVKCTLKALRLKAASLMIEADEKCPALLQEIQYEMTNIGRLIKDMCPMSARELFEEMAKNQSIIAPSPQFIAATSEDVVSVLSSSVANCNLDELDALTPAFKISHVAKRVRGLTDD